MLWTCHVSGMATGGGRDDNKQTTGIDGTEGAQDFEPLPPQAQFSIR